MYLFVDEEIKNRDQDHWDQAHHEEVSNLNGRQRNKEDFGSVIIDEMILVVTKKIDKRWLMKCENIQPRYSRLSR